MQTETTSQQNPQNASPASKVLSARPGDLQPLVDLWRSKNPRVADAHLVRDALKLYFKQTGIVGKRYAHLVEN